jgi:hypothetical protein
MPKAEWAENTIEKILTKANLWRFNDGDIVSVLDVACGLSLKSKFINAQIRVGVDIHEKYFEYIETTVPYVVLKYDVRKLREIFPPRSFDVVVALDIVEHLEKSEALDMISQCEEIARKAVIIETPLGFVPQNIDIQGHGGDQWQTHRSGWEVEEFNHLGYQSVTREYIMANVKRHTDLDVGTDIRLIDAIKYLR